MNDAPLGASHGKLHFALIHQSQLLDLAGIKPRLAANLESVTKELPIMDYLKADGCLSRA